MADILLHSTVPSLHNQTESAANLILDTPAAATTSKNDSHPTNKYNGHVTRLRNVFNNSPSNPDNHLKSKSMIMDRQFYHDDIPYTMIHRKLSNADSHYDFPADAVEQYKKQQQQREENELQIVPALLPSNVVRRMNHLNTTFVKPTRIERSLPTTTRETIEDPSKSDDSPMISGKH